MKSGWSNTYDENLLFNKAFSHVSLKLSIYNIYSIIFFYLKVNAVYNFHTLMMTSLYHKGNSHPWSGSTSSRGCVVNWRLKFNGRLCWRPKSNGLLSWRFNLRLKSNGRGGWMTKVQWYGEVDEYLQQTALTDWHISSEVNNLTFSKLSTLSQFVHSYRTLRVEWSWRVVLKM